MYIYGLHVHYYLKLCSLRTLIYAAKNKKCKQEMLRIWPKPQCSSRPLGGPDLFMHLFYYSIMQIPWLIHHYSPSQSSPSCGTVSFTKKKVSLLKCTRNCNLLEIEFQNIFLWLVYKKMLFHLIHILLFLCLLT